MNTDPPNLSAWDHFRTQPETLISNFAVCQPKNENYMALLVAVKIVVATFMVVLLTSKFPPIVSNIIANFAYSVVVMLPLILQFSIVVGYERLLLHIFITDR